MLKNKLELRGNILEVVTAVIGLYLHEDLLKDKSLLHKGKRFNEKQAEKYNWLIYEVLFSHRRIASYKKIFSELYFPSATQREKIECLEYHMHSYLEDSDRLKNKIANFLNIFSTDYTKISKELDTADTLEALKETPHRVFKKMSDIRNPHHHRGTTFNDASVLKARNAIKIAEEVTSGFAQTFVDPIKAKEMSERLSKEAADLFEKRSSQWANDAERNALEIEKYFDHIFLYIRPRLFLLLDVKDPL